MIPKQGEKNQHEHEKENKTGMTAQQIAQLDQPQEIKQAQEKPRLLLSCIHF
jgi:hypothetical protein